MDALDFLDPEDYFHGLCSSNRYAKKHNFHCCSCSGIDTIEGPLEQFKRENAFFCTDDTADGQFFQGRGGGWFMRRTFTVFIMHRYTFNDMKDRKAKLAVCRNLFRQIVSKMLVDSDSPDNEYAYLHTESILSRNFGKYFLNGCTGLYFMIDISEPVDLRYINEEWDN